MVPENVDCIRALAGRGPYGDASIKAPDRSLGVASSFLPATSRLLEHVTAPAVEHPGVKAMPTRCAEFRGVGFDGAEETTD